MSDVEQTVEAPASGDTVADGFFASVYSKIVAEVKAVEKDALAVEAKVKASIEAFAAGISAKLHSLHAEAAVVAADVKTDVAEVETKV